MPDAKIIDINSNLFLSYQNGNCILLIQVVYCKQVSLSNMNTIFLKLVIYLKSYKLIYIYKKKEIIIIQKYICICYKQKDGS